jgi:hypothetical protein
MTLKCKQLVENKTFNNGFEICLLGGVKLSKFCLTFDQFNRSISVSFRMYISEDKECSKAVHNVEKSIEKSRALQKSFSNIIRTNYCSSGSFRLFAIIWSWKFGENR